MRQLKIGKLSSRTKVVVEKKKESSQTFALSESPKGIENCQRRSFTTLQIVLTIGLAFV